LKSESVVAEISYNTLRENAGGNDTVSISAWRGGGISSTECCCRGWLFADFFAHVKVVGATSSDGFVVQRRATSTWLIVAPRHMGYWKILVVPVILSTFNYCT